MQEEGRILVILMVLDVMSVNGFTLEGMSLKLPSRLLVEMT